MTSLRIVVACLGLTAAAPALAELRVYDVDSNYRQEMYAALQGVLVQNPQAVSPGRGTWGRVQLLPTGQIVVDAAPETHVQIEALLDAVGERRIDVTPRAAFRYWVLLGSRGAGADQNVPGVLSEVVAELERVHGPMAFRVLGTAALVTDSGQEGEVDGLTLAVSQRAYVQDDTASAEIDMRLIDRPRRLSSVAVVPNEGSVVLDVTLRRGEIVVLGENTVQTEELDGTLFYIVHWPESE